MTRSNRKKNLCGPKVEKLKFKKINRKLFQLTFEHKMNKCSLKLKEKMQIKVCKKNKNTTKCCCDEDTIFIKACHILIFFIHCYSANLIIIP